MPFNNQRSPSAPIVYGDISIDPSDGSIVGQLGSFESIALGGQDLSETLTLQGDRDTAQESRLDSLEDSRAQGVRVIRRWRVKGTTNPITTTTRLMAYSFVAKAGHTYLFVVPSLLMRIVSPAAGKYCGIQVIIKTNDSRPDSTHRSYTYPASTSETAGTLGGMDIMLDRTTYAADATMSVYVNVVTSSSHGSVSIDQSGNETNFLIIDLGAVSSPYSDIQLTEIGGTEEPPTETDPTTPVTKSYTGTFYATHYATYSLNSEINYTSDYPGLILQSTAVTPRIGMVGFNGTDNHGRTLSNLTGSNVTIKSANVYIGASYGGKSVRWYYSSGGTGRLYWHGVKSGFPNSGIPSRSFIGEITSWKNGQERSYNLSSILSKISNGTFGGIALSGEGRTGQNTYHGEFPYRVKLVISYTVTT